jgi:photosystem II stability/assembly factor-like uncharacterized protein
MKNLIVGTEDGLIRLRAENGSWKAAPDRALKAKKVLCGRKVGRRLVASCYGDAVHVSDDQGVSWRPVEDSRLRKVRCLTHATWNGQEVLFAGTEPVGLYVSRDDGDSWTEIGAVGELQEKRQWNYPVPGVDPHVRDVVVDDADQDTLYVAVQVGGILVGRQRARVWEESIRGLNPDVHRVLIESSDRSTFYAATGEEGIFVSHDAGREWRRCGADVPWTYTIPFETWGANRLVAGMGRGLPNLWNERPEGAEAVLVVSKDGGQSWSATFPEAPLSSMIMTLMFTSPSKDSVIVGTGVTIGADVKASGELYNVDLNGGEWKLAISNLPGINFILEG